MKQDIYSAHSAITDSLIKRGYIPLDKSWMIRMGVLDLVHGKKDCTEYLGKNQWKLSEDLKALQRACLEWRIGTTIDVGESGTLYRFLRFASWKLGLHKHFMMHGTLRQRNICDNPEIVNWSLKDLLMLDGKDPKKRGTSQWASASVIMGNQERLEDIKDPPFKLKLTYKAVEHWNKMRSENKCWEPIYDETNLLQALTFLDILNHRQTRFRAQQAEDYCFGRAFGFISKFLGEAKWPSLRGHESDRIEEMEKELASENEEKIESKDHRVIQAKAMLLKTRGIPVRILHRSDVNKSWPQFWNFLEDSTHL
jgi:hypothetical protein